MKHETIRHRHELRRRRLRVVEVADLSPAMRRIVLTGEDLVGFTSLSPDDHVKLFVPGVGEAERRDYTPRRYDAAANQLWIDFALHDAGPATQWAREATPGATIEIGGPRGSVVVPADFDWWLLVGDETALPAIGRRLEELPTGTPVTSIVTVGGPEEELDLAGPTGHQTIWLHRSAGSAADPAPILAALDAFERPAGDGFVWIAAEAAVARAARAHVLDAWGHPPAWLKAAGYWFEGRADATEKF